MLAEKKVEKQDPKSKDKESNKVNSPMLNSEGKPTVRAITSAKQAHTIAKSIIQMNEDGRQKVNAIVSSKYNGEAPFIAAKLSQDSQAWRANFSTNFLGSIIDRVTPQILDPIHKAAALTHATLPSNHEDAANKSRVFCEAITKVIRQWKGWKDFTSRIAQDTVLFGGAIPVRTSDDWRPVLWRSDEIFLPEGTGQHSSEMDMLVIRHKMRLSDLIKILSNPKAAALAGYNFESCQKVVNEAPSGNQTAETKTHAATEDARREAAGVDDDQQNPTRSIPLYTVIVKDHTGEIDLWTVSANEGAEIRNVEKLHKRPEDAAAFFTMQAGNGRFYGSKGLGRLLANLHIAIERGRCLATDGAFLSQMLMLTSEAENANMAADVRFPFIILPNGASVVEQKFSFKFEEWNAMDSKLTSIADSIAGAFIPPNIDQQGSSNTKIEAAQKAERELAVKEGVLGRFFDHSGALIWMMTTGICSEANIREASRVFASRKKSEEKGLRKIASRIFGILKRVLAPAEFDALKVEEERDSRIADQQAVECLVGLLERGLSVEEIVVLSECQPVSNSPEEGTDVDNRTLAFIANNKMSPYIDQSKAAKMEATISVGEQRANQLIINQEDPNIVAAATRQQLIEFGEIMDGVEMPVVGSDNHIIHRKVLSGKFDELLPAIQQAPTPEIINAAKLAISHYVAHLQADQITPKSELSNEQQVIGQLTQMVAQAEKMLAEQPQGGPPAVQGTPLQAGEGGMGDAPQPDEADAARAASEAHLKAASIALKGEELNFRKQQHDDNLKVEATKLQTSLLNQVQQQANKTTELGLKEAAKDREGLR